MINKILRQIRFQVTENLPHQYKNLRRSLFHNFKLNAKVMEVDVEGKPMRFYCTSQRAINRVRSIYKSEPGTVNWILENFREDDVFYDVGANIGVYTLLASRKITRGKIYAFEPHAVTFATLLSNVEMNGLAERVSTCSAALHRELGFLDFRYVNLTPATSGSQFGEFNDVSTSLDSRIEELKAGVSIDHLIEHGVITPPTCVKIDVDGNESQIIDGMAKLLASNKKPRTVLIEVRGDTREMIQQQFFRNDYEITAEVVYRPRNATDDNPLNNEYNLVFTLK